MEQAEGAPLDGGAVVAGAPPQQPEAPRLAVGDVHPKALVGFGEDVAPYDPGSSSDDDEAQAEDSASVAAAAAAHADTAQGAAVAAAQVAHEHAAGMPATTSPAGTSAAIDDDDDVRLLSSSPQQPIAAVATVKRRDPDARRAVSFKPLSELHVITSVERNPFPIAYADTWWVSGEDGADGDGNSPIMLPASGAFASNGPRPAQERLEDTKGKPYVVHRRDIPMCSMAHIAALPASPFPRRAAKPAAISVKSGLEVVAMAAARIDPAAFRRVPAGSPVIIPTRPPGGAAAAAVTKPSSTKQPAPQPVAPKAQPPRTLGQLKQLGAQLAQTKGRAASAGGVAVAQPAAARSVPSSGVPKVPPPQPSAATHAKQPVPAHAAGVRAQQQQQQGPPPPIPRAGSGPTLAASFSGAKAAAQPARPQPSAVGPPLPGPPVPAAAAWSHRNQQHQQPSVRNPHHHVLPPPPATAAWHQQQQQQHQLHQQQHQQQQQQDLSFVYAGLPPPVRSGGEGTQQPGPPLPPSSGPAPPRQ